MKILFFICTLDEGGGQRVVSMLSSKMVERGFDVEVLKYYNSESIYPISDRVKINSVECNNGRSIISNIIWMRSYFKKNADIVISFLAPFNIIALLANMFNKTPIIVADRNDPRFVPNNKIVRKLRDFLYRFANGVVVQTTDNKKYFSDTIQNKTIVIKNPFSMTDKIGKALKVKKNNEIVSVGRLEKQKNQEMLIKAFYELRKEYDYKLTIYGEGAYRKELEELINQLNLNDYVFLPGTSKDVLEDIKHACCFVLSSNYEGMPNALAEAMCLGLPVISTKVSGASDLIRNNENGLLIDVGDEDALINSLKKVLDNQDYRNLLAKNASKISKKLDIDVITNQWLEFINKVK